VTFVFVISITTAGVNVGEKQSCVTGKENYNDVETLHRCTYIHTHIHTYIYTHTGVLISP